MTAIKQTMIMAAALALPATAANATDGGKATPHRGETMQDRGKAVLYRKVETKNYTLEVPEGWEVGPETPFGQREIVPAGQAGKEKGPAMSSMTGPGLGAMSWEDLYKTSLYFIMRYAPEGVKMKPGPYRLAKSREGFESCSWSMMDPAGRVLQQHVILKRDGGNILALSVKLPPDASRVSRERLDSIFRHMVDTAVVR